MKKILASLLMLSTVTAFASEIEHQCHLRLNLSDAQKLELKRINSESAERLKALKLQAKAAKKASKGVMLKLVSSKEEALQATLAVKEVQKEIQSLKTAKELAVLFDVLTPEQRIQKVKCLKKNKKIPAGSLGQYHRGRRHPSPIEISPRRHNRVIFGRPQRRFRIPIVARPAHPAAYRVRVHHAPIRRPL